MEFKFKRFLSIFELIIFAGTSQKYTKIAQKAYFLNINNWSFSRGPLKNIHAYFLNINNWSFSRGPLKNIHAPPPPPPPPPPVYKYIVYKSFARHVRSQ